MKTGLVLEGGAMRGIFTAGVIDILMENGIDFDGAIGVSAGAVFGCNFKSRQIGRVVRYNKKYCNDWRFGGIRSLLLTGNYYGEEFCYHVIPEKLDPFDTDTFAANPLHFYIVATDIETGKPVYHELKKGTGVDMEWFRASASMPMVSKPVIIGGRGYLDGGISDSIPIDYFESIGYEKNIVVLTQPRDYVKKTSSAQKWIDKAMRKYPELIKDMHARADQYNEVRDRLAAREAAGDANLLCIYPPEDLGISRTEKDVNEIERVYQIGRNTAINMLPQIKAFLEIS